MSDLNPQNSFDSEKEELPTFQNPSPTLPKELEQKITNLVAVNKKIEAIKELRKYTGSTLIEAKSYIDALAMGQKISFPLISTGNFPNTQNNDMSTFTAWLIVFFISLFLGLMTAVPFSQLLPQLLYVAKPFVCPNGNVAPETIDHGGARTSVEFKCIQNSITEDKTFNYMVVSIVIYTFIYFIIIFYWSSRNKQKKL